MKSFDNHFYNLFLFTVKPGTNSIKRHSSDSSVTVPDIPSFHSLFNDADKAVEDGSELQLSKFTRSCGIPNRMLLPKGNPEGMEFWFSVFVSDAKEDTDMEHPESDEHGGTHSQCGVHGEKYPDKKPMGYPFDRRIPDDNVFMRSDSFTGSLVKIYHTEKH